MTFTDLDDDLGVLVRQPQRTIEDLQVFLQIDGGSGQLLLVGMDDVIQLSRTVQEHQSTVVLRNQTGSDSFLQGPLGIGVGVV